ncbi:MAG TPA: DUF58 domain-containing protein [Actinomycetota bacterium]|nr:DUF58 domain-containing protein [Actinomycetota bacterium]
MRPTRRALALGGTGLLLLLAATTAQAGWLFVLSAGVLGLVLASVFIRHRLGAAAISRQLPQRARVGDPVRVGLTVANNGRGSLPLMLISDSFPAFEPVVVACEPIPSGESAHIELVRAPTRRGVFAGGSVTLTAAAPYGVLRSAKTLKVDSSITVVPQWVDLPTWPILEPSSFPSDVLHERARTGAGEEYLGVRDYRPGDPRRWVHWRSSARAGRLVVREYEEETASRVALVLAGADVGDPPDSAFEALVSGMASIALYALVTGHPVDLLAVGADNEVMELSGPDRTATLEWLAHVQPRDVSLAAPVARALQRLRRRGTVVMFVPSRGQAATSLEPALNQVQSSGSRAAAVVARASTWGTGVASAEETHLLQRLPTGRAGVRTVGYGEDLLKCLLH